jgi:hypothetical protein
MEIVRTRQFVKDLRRIGMTEVEQARLEDEIKSRPGAAT